MSKYVSVITLALSLFMVTYAVNLQAPLYSDYAAESNVGAAAVTLAFAAYVAGLMPTLVFLGGLSDRVGRRIPLFIALLLGVLATYILVVFPGWESLVIARVALGIGTGLATTSGAAYMTEIMGQKNERKAALIVTSATSLGFGGGALATSTSLAVQGFTFIPFSFIMLFVIAPALFIGSLILPRLDKTKKVALLRFPVFPKGVWVFGMGLLVAWSTTGMTIAIIPLQLEASGLESWTGLVIFLAIFMGFLCQPIARKLSNTGSLIVGYILIPAGYLILLFGINQQSIELLLIGTAVTSCASYGFTYLAALSEFTMRAPENRARATAGLFVYAYVGFSIPVIGSGILADILSLNISLYIFGAFQISTIILTVIVRIKQIQSCAIPANSLPQD